MRRLPPERCLTWARKYSTAGIWSRPPAKLAKCSTTGSPEPPALSPLPAPLQPPARTAATTVTASAASHLRPFIHCIVPLLSSRVEGDARRPPSRKHRGWLHSHTV